MTLGAKGPRRNLRPGLDSDVSQVLKKLEDANDGKPFKTTSSAYEAIKRSNSSLSRQKKRPLEDSIDRVLQFRKQELGESSDSEAELEEPPKPDDDRFLLNKQMTKHWHTPTSTLASQDATPQTAPQTTSEGSRTAKKRRVQEDGAVTPKGALTDQDAAPTEKQEKALAKKTTKSSRYKVEHPTDAVPIAGVHDIYKELWKQMYPVLKEPELYAKHNFRKVTGILLSGPPGLGKKALIKFLASKIEVPIMSITGCFDDPERVERSLNDAVEEAMRIAPCIVLIENVDWYMPTPGDKGHSDGQRRNVIQFMRQMQRLRLEQDQDRHILAMATTSKYTDIDPAVLKTGLLERTVQMSIPDCNKRQDILELITKDCEKSETVNFAELSRITHGFVPSDLVNVMTLAQEVAVTRSRDLTQCEKHSNSPSDQFSDLMEIVDEQPQPLASELPIRLTQEDFTTAIKTFVPSLRKEGFTVIPNVSWDHVGALRAARDQLHMSIIGPIKDPALYHRAGIVTPAGCLLWGPPGCGKTLVAQAVANEAQASFILIKGPELLNKYVGESERAVRELFSRARSSAPCILFFDEMDSLVPKRNSASTEASTRVVNTLLTELDGAQDRKGVFVIGTSNRVDMIDPAILRPGRISERLFIDLPTEDERVDILRTIYRTNRPAPTLDELDRLEYVARDPRCKDFSGADLGGLRVTAAQSALRRYKNNGNPELEVAAEDWEHALSTTRPSVSDPETYRKLEAKMGKSD